MLWMGIWVHPYTVTYLCRWGPNFGNLGMMLWCHGWDCKQPLTASRIHFGSIESVWEPSYAVDGHMGAPLHCYTCAGDGQIFGNWGEVNPIWHHGVMVEAVNHHWLLLTSILDIESVWAPSYAVDGHMGAPLHCFLCRWVQIFGNWGSKVKPKWCCCACHGWGCKPLLTASHIHIECVERDWAPSYAVDGHMDAPLHCYTCASGGQILEIWGKMEPKWHCGVMVETVTHHWLHPTSILDV